MQLPLSVLRGGPGAILGAFVRALAAGEGRVKLAVVDHIASFPPVTFPVADLCAACRAAGAKGERMPNPTYCSAFSPSLSTLCHMTSLAGMRAREHEISETPVVHLLSHATSFTYIPSGIGFARQPSGVEGWHDPHTMYVSA